MKQVYATLAATMLSASVGSVFYMYTHLSPFISTIAMMVLLFGLTFESSEVQVEKRIPRLLLLGSSKGLL